MLVGDRLTNSNVMPELVSATHYKVHFAYPFLQMGAEISSA
jgi:hypothetical protein